MSVEFEPVVSREGLEEFIVFLNDDHDGMGGSPRMGKEIEFMERNGFDSALIFRYYRGWVNGLESPLAIPSLDGSRSVSGRDDVYQRTIGLQLRDYYREKWDLPMLTMQEKRDWSIDPYPLLNTDRTEYYPLRDPTLPNLLTETEIDETVSYMIASYSEIVRYFLTVRSVSEAQGYTGYDEVGRTSLVNGCIDDSIQAIIRRPLVGGGQIFQVQTALLASPISHQL
jgi:hypothetical protein